MGLNQKTLVLLSVVTFLLFTLNGCEKDDVETIYPTIYKYDIKSMFYPILVRPDTTDENNYPIY
jgi:hypothetical protein